jgi:hypothetical protein
MSEMAMNSEVIALSQRGYLTSMALLANSPNVAEKIHALNDLPQDDLVGKYIQYEGEEGYIYTIPGNDGLDTLGRNYKLLPAGVKPEQVVHVALAHSDRLQESVRSVIRDLRRAAPNDQAVRDQTAAFDNALLACADRYNDDVMTRVASAWSETIRRSRNEPSEFIAATRVYLDQAVVEAEQRRIDVCADMWITAALYLVRDISLAASSAGLVGLSPLVITRPREASVLRAMKAAECRPHEIFDSRAAAGDAPARAEAADIARKLAEYVILGLTPSKMATFLAAKAARDGHTRVLRAIADGYRDLGDETIEEALDARPYWLFYKNLFLATPYLHGAWLIAKSVVTVDEVDEQERSVFKRIANDCEEKVVRISMSLMEGCEGRPLLNDSLKLIAERGRTEGAEAARVAALDLIENRLQYRRSDLTMLLGGTND